MELDDLEDACYAVRVRNGRKHYAADVFKDLNLDVPKGCIYGLLGPSGCGKTTLLSCIIGLKKLSSGDVRVLGEAPVLRRASKIGYMPQQISLCDEFTIAESMRFFGWIAGLDAIRVKKRVEFIVNLLMLPDVDRKIGSLSGGQQRRVSFATALLHEPELLILDEPTVGLDPILRETIWNYLLTLAKNDGVTIIMTTHYIDEARQADRIGLMRDGTIICEDSPTKLLVRVEASSLEEAFYKVIVRQGQGASRRAALTPTLKTPVSNMIRLNNLHALLWKNTKWMLKNYLFITTVLLLPVLTIFVFGTAIGGDPKNLTVGVLNYETRDSNCGELTCNSTHLSCHFLKYLDDDVVTIVPLESEGEAQSSVIKGKSYASIIIRDNYTESLKKRLEGALRIPSWRIDASTIEIVYDATVKDIAFFIKMSFFKSFQRFAEDFVESCGTDKKTVASPINFLTPIYGVNRQRYTDFACPGVLLSMAFFLSMALTAGVTLIERNEGILERVLVFGVNTIEIITGHVISLMGIMVLQSLCPLLVLYVFFDITMKGSVFLIITFTLTTGLCGMCGGLAVSSWCATERNAVYLLLGAFFPLIIVSGILWPLEAMNYYLKIVSSCMPLTMPIDSLRNVLQKGWDYSNPSIYVGLIVINVWTIIFLVAGVVGQKIGRN
ncbi:hypothetical protein FQR65_LT04984 [Abscondita terminalis]|nr:hypothetical protein FQR65_LT04984 [Abscondita terminalis]